MIKFIKKVFEFFVRIVSLLKYICFLIKLKIKKIYDI